MRPNSQFPVDLVTFTEENVNGKLHSLSMLNSTNIVVELKVVFCQPK